MNPGRSCHDLQGANGHACVELRVGDPAGDTRWALAVEEAGSAASALSYTTASATPATRDGHPATGRLQVSLSWNHAANFDLILAADDLAEVRLADGIEDGEEPEHLGIDVVLGQKLFTFVAAWAGEPGPYVLGIVLLGLDRNQAGVAPGRTTCP